MADAFIVAAGSGLVASAAAGRALVYGVRLLPERRHRSAEWTVVGLAVLVAAASLFARSAQAAYLFAFTLAALPGLVAYLAWRTVLASTMVSILPLYFVIAEVNRGRTMHAPATALDRMIPLEPAWAFVYASLVLCVLLPLLVVRDQRLFRQTLKAYLLVWAVAFAGFLIYPTVAPRPAVVEGEGIAAWFLRLTYSLDTPYNCFPSLHVAQSFVAALACYRVRRSIGVAAAIWASLVAVSTVYTKQHYVADVIAGTLMAFAAYGVFLRGSTIPSSSDSPNTPGASSSAPTIS